MDLIVFELAVIGRRPDGALLIALMDGAEERRQSHRCVALLSCRPETAQAMCEAVGSALKAI